VICKAWDGKGCGDCFFKDKLDECVKEVCTDVRDDHQSVNFIQVSYGKKNRKPI